MFATTGIIQDNTVYIKDCVLDQYNGRKVIITILDEDNCYDTIPNQQLSEISDSIITKNMKAYQELAK
ncbi:hypothetical protein E4O03_10480 [Treponema sp. OMZ 792]|uniref:hypothetical protein n=1 Tax=unclassified Treponema TaxID=2638727 RepID=UPI0020A51018|nr:MULTISPECIES: hypothetical protein [unclassified Treponema]UTC62899.1 hypothetical protein E4O05_03110 [Treponema sp. OMZ 787]UTC64247.1 hypothetical protein E4O00_10460 [Treponema sp. OMZ 788]UTC67128.1 hypothetical protein E4O06_00190 [Treponema sp. OMZ 789]UTC69859.1 hypothetical protein E4O01_00190 [Treponema sp. OMZ 790]UTC72573.1 hypothetical protein E4O02_00190 [Treponema sp. OMZ 791]